MYRPQSPFTVPLFYHTITESKSYGVTVKTKSTGILFYASFKSFGGTEITLNDVISVQDTAIIETWFNPEITSECIITDTNGKEYEILGTPENLSMRNQFMRFKVKAVNGSA